MFPLEFRPDVNRQVSEITSALLHITTIHRSGFLPAQIKMTLNDLECPVELKVRFTDGTFDIRLLRVSDSTIRIGVARGGAGGVGWRA